MFVENKIVILLIFIFIFFTIIKNIKFFILTYIALRSFIAIFYKTNIFFEFNVLELSGVIFPFILLFYWARNNFKITFNSRIYINIFIFTFIWVLISTISSSFQYRFLGLYSLNNFFRIFTGFMVFITFPLLFNTLKDVDSLINAYFVGTVFPLVQGFLQLFVGINIVGMRVSAFTAGSSDNIMYFGLYHKYGWYALTVIIGGCLVIYKMDLKRSNYEIKKSFLYIIIFMLYIMLAFITISRTLFFDLIVITTFLFLSVRKSKIHISILLAVILIFVSTGFYKNQFNKLLVRSDSEFQVLRGERDIDFAFHGRAGLWKNKLQQFNERSFLEKLVGTELGIGPHGDYIQWILSYGYIGIFLYILLILSIFFGTIRNYLSREKSNHIFYAYGLMVIATLIIWLIGSFIYNPSRSPDLTIFVLGNVSIFLSIGNELKGRNFSESKRPCAKGLN